MTYLMSELKHFESFQVGQVLELTRLLSTRNAL